MALIGSSALLSSACGSSAADDERLGPLGAPFAIGGGPLGDAAPVAGTAPLPRDYASDVQLTPVAHRPKVAASGLTKVSGWLNTTRPFTGEELEGRIVVVDFWTAGCVNCIHVAPTLEALGQKHQNDPLVILGVHAQKFTADAPPEVVRVQMQELGITHPVALDPEHQVLDDWDVAGWPTLFVIDARGRVVKKLGGEPALETLDGIVESALHEQAAEGGLATEALGFLGHEKDPSSPLATPEKIIALPDGFAIADSGHDRLVLADAAGALLDVVGNGSAGASDGPFPSAAFSAPKGLAVDGDVLYVADTANHRIRAVDRKAHSVTTLAGTGQRGDVLNGGGPALTTALASPWDVAWVAGRLFIANAGTHQIATYDPKTQTLAAFAGNGHEGLVDGPKDQAEFAQPSGLASDGTSLYVADAESSSIRKIDLVTNEVTTLIGEGLFAWGDSVGPAGSAKLQHPQGIALLGNRLFIADTYNSKLKALDLSAAVVAEIAGGGTPPWFFYPGGLAPFGAGGELLVADTQHDAIVRVDPTGASEPKRWDLIGLSPP